MKKIELTEKNRNIWKWISYNLVIILFSISLILNIVYLPKYFHLKNNPPVYTTTTIEGIDNSNSAKPNDKIFSFTYNSKFTTLGDLMANYNQTYHISKSSFGRFLNGISFFSYQEQGQKTLTGSTTDKTYWQIEQNGKSTPVGIDSLYLKSNETFELVFTKY